MDIVERVKNICLTPASEWVVIAEEPASTGGLLTGYVAPLAAVGAVAGFVGGSVIGRNLGFISYRVPIVTGLSVACLTFVMAVVGIFVLSLIINALAPTFGGQPNGVQALKVAAYSYTPGLVAAVLNVLPLLGVLAIIGALYGLYLLYLGLPRLMKCPADRAVGYTAVVVVCAIVLSVVVTTITGAVIGIGALGTGALGSTLGRSSGRTATAGADDVQFDKNTPLGKLQELGKKMEESNKKIEEAKKSGDTNAQAAAALEGLGTLFGGGKHVDPIGIDQLKPFVPESFAGLPQQSHSAEKTGLASLMISKAEATYGDGAGKRVTLEISDTGGASGLVGLASWASLQEEKDDDNGSERTSKVDGRMVHERSSKRGGNNEFSTIVGERFVVSATGSGVDLKDLKAAVARLDLAKLDAMKDVGVTK